jgi:hypothetical protein
LVSSSFGAMSQIHGTMCSVGQDPNGPTPRSFGTPSDAGGARTNRGAGSEFGSWEEASQ